MNGVDILSFEEVVTKTTINTDLIEIAVCIIMSLAFIVGIIVAIYECDPATFFILFLFGLIVSGIAAMIIREATETPSEYETQYKVIISDDVSLNEFNERYEIIDQEGRIYTVRER